MSDHNAKIADALVAGLVREGLTYAGGKLACLACSADGGRSEISHRRECPRHGSLTSYLSMGAVVTTNARIRYATRQGMPTCGRSIDELNIDELNISDLIIDEYAIPENPPNPKFIGDFNPAVVELVRRAFD